MKDDYFPNNETDMPELTSSDAENAIPLKDFISAKKSVTIRLRSKTLFYFQSLAQKTGIPYQTLINLYLDDCAQRQLQPETIWKPL